MTPRFRDPARLAGARLLRLQSDERLITLTRDGHEAAFAAIVDRYRPALERYAERIVGRSRSEDAVQQAFVNAHRAMLRDDRAIQLKAWLYRITHNAALNMLRTVHDDLELDDATYGPPATAMAASGAIEDVVELHARLRETLDAISSLPVPQRDALLLRELEGRSHDEIALALGITSGAARQHVMRARVALRAAATAVTPFPLISHLTASMTRNPDAAGTAGGVFAGAGAGAVGLKLTAGFAATGALVSAFAVPAIRPDDLPARPSPAVAAQHGGPDRTDDPKPTVAIVRASRAGSAGADLPVADGDEHDDARPRARPRREDRDEDRHSSAPDRSGHDDDREDREDGEDRPTEHDDGRDRSGDTEDDRAISSGSGPSDDSADDDSSASGSSGSDSSESDPAGSGSSGSGSTSGSSHGTESVKDAEEPDITPEPESTSGETTVTDPLVDD